MRRDVNQIVLIGNAGTRPRFSMTAGGREVAQVSLATSVSRRDKTSGKETRHTEWHQLLFLGPLAVECCVLVHKGTKLFVEGKLVTGDDVVDGKKRRVTEINVKKYSVLSGQSVQPMSPESALAQLKASIARCTPSPEPMPTQARVREPMAVAG